MIQGTLLIVRITNERFHKYISYVRPIQRGSSDDLGEKQIILKLCGVTLWGEGVDGTSDTLKYLDNNAMLEHRPIRMGLIGSILRFADELAEGNHRTSHFMIQGGRFPSESMVFHRYALCSQVNVDRNGERICLTYHIKLRFDGNGDTEDHSIIRIEDLQELLNFIYYRIAKLNQERQLCKALLSIT